MRRIERIDEEDDNNIEEEAKKEVKNVAEGKCEREKEIQRRTKGSSGKWPVVSR